MSPPTVEERRRSNLEIAEAIAPTWEGRRADVESFAAPVREWLLRELAPVEGDTVLELAAGIGDTGFAAADVIGEQGMLLSSDFSPRMLDGARRRGAELGVSNVDYRVVDALAMDLEDDSVDGVLCRFAFMLMADPAAALAETRRVLRIGGRLALAVWGLPDDNPYFTVAVVGLVTAGHMPPPDPADPGVFAMATADRTTTLLEDAGFLDVRTEEVPVEFAVAGVEEYLDLVADTAGPIGLLMQGLSETDRAELREQAADALASFAAEDGLRIPGIALCAVAS